MCLHAQSCVTALFVALCLVTGALIATPGLTQESTNNPALDRALAAQDYAQTYRIASQLAAKDDPVGQEALGDLYQNGRGVSRDDAQAVAWYQKSAAHGNARAQAELGLMYFYGRGVELDRKRALELFSKAADQGDAVGQTALAYMYFAGVVLKQDAATAADLYRKAAAQHYVPALAMLGSLTERGDGAPRDAVQASSLYRQALSTFRGIKQPDAPTISSVAWLYQDGRGIPQDYREAEVLNRRAAELGFAPAQSQLCALLFAGKGVTRDLGQAASWCRQAAEQGAAWAQNQLGYMYETGTGTKKDLPAAKEWYEKAAAQGLSYAADRLRQLPDIKTAPAVIQQAQNAREHSTGTTTPTLPGQKSAEAGTILSGQRYSAMTGGGAALFGITVRDAHAGDFPKNFWQNRAAVVVSVLPQSPAARANLQSGDVIYNINNKDLHSAADLVNANWPNALSGPNNQWVSIVREGRTQMVVVASCAFALKKPEDELTSPADRVACGDVYSKERRYGDALKWYQKAADQGYAPAQIAIASAYREGRGVPQSNEEALTWYRKAAEQGNADAQNVVGSYYDNGWGVRRDDGEAEKWYQKAADQGLAAAQVNLKNLKARQEQALRQRQEAERAAAAQQAALNAQHVAELEQRRQMAQRAAESRQRYDSFVSKAGIVDSPPSEKLKANPFAYEGKVIGLWVWFDQMLTRDSAIFAGEYVVSGVPEDKFRQKMQVLLAARVLGTEPVDTPFGGKVSLPHLKFVDVYPCQDQNNCDDLMFWKHPHP